MGYVTSGLMNKQIAHEVGLAEITVKIHRSNVMRKMWGKVIRRIGANGGNAWPATSKSHTALKGDRAALALQTN